MEDSCVLEAFVLNCVDAKMLSRTETHGHLMLLQGNTAECSSMRDLIRVTRPGLSKAR